MQKCINAKIQKCKNTKNAKNTSTLCRLLILNLRATVCNKVKVCCAKCVMYLKFVKICILCLQNYLLIEFFNGFDEFIHQVHSIKELMKCLRICNDF